MKKEYNIEYQEGYPNSLAGNWVAFEFQGGSLDGTISSEPYDLVTSLDPNRYGYLILDKIYASDVRVRAEYSDSSFYIFQGENLEIVGENQFGINYITTDGYVTTNPVLINTLYSLAGSYFENMSFDKSYIEDLIFLRAGFYDQYRSRIDTVLILGYRRTGLEDVDY